MREDYKRVTAGGIPGYAETDRRVWWEGPKQLIQFTADGVQTDGDLRTSTFEAFCGDARIRLRLDVGFAPEGARGGGLLEAGHDLLPVFSLRRGHPPEPT